MRSLLKENNLLLTVSIAASIFFVIFFSRQIFSFRYEPEYYENLYYFSQWNIPQSTRGISDGELYKFVGFRLAEGENPFDINFEVPPFAKHLYGLAEKYIGNPYWISLVFYFGLIGVLFAAVKDLIGPKKILPSILLLVTTPFIATQIRETMLDLPLTFLFLTHALFFGTYLKRGKLLDLLISGLFLGLATGTKIGVYTPFISVLGALILLIDKKGLKNIFLYTGSIFAGYVLSFNSYFLRHPNPIPWLRLHAKPLKFYLGSSVDANYMDQFKTLFTGIFEAWASSGKLGYNDWSPVLAVGAIAGVVVLRKSLAEKNWTWVYMSALAIIFLLVNSLIPFYPRYVMPAVPIFILLVARLFKKTNVLIILALLNIPFLVSSVAIQDVRGDVGAFAHFVSSRAYRELYRSITPENRNDIKEIDFVNTLEDLFTTLDTRAIDVKVANVTEGSNKALVEFEINYETRYGHMTHKPKVTYEKINNQWRANWQWDYILPQYSPDKEIVVVEKGTAFSKLVDKEGKTLATKGPGKAVYMIPRLMFDWGQSLDQISSVVGADTSKIDELIRRSIPDDLPRFVGYLNPNLAGGIEKAEAIKGVKLKDIEYFAKNTLHNDSLMQVYELNKNSFFVQADIFLKDEVGDQILIHSYRAPEGSDVIVF